MLYKECVETVVVYMATYQPSPLPSFIYEVRRYSPNSQYNLIMKCESQPEMTDRHMRIWSVGLAAESNRLTAFKTISMRIRGKIFVPIYSENYSLCFAI